MLHVLNGFEDKYAEAHSFQRQPGESCVYRRPMGQTRAHIDLGPPMDHRTASRRSHLDSDPPERRASAKARGPSRLLLLLKNLWARPLGLQRQGRGLKLVLVERRRPPSPDEPPKLALIRSELRERLLGHKHVHAAQVMRHLALVHDEIGRAGWPGVEVLPGSVLGLAMVQAEMLASEAPSRVMTYVIERLRIFKVAADVREERDLREKREKRAAAVRAADAAEPVESGLDEPAGWARSLPTPLVIPHRLA